jgi:hypothetical protein
VAAGQVRQGPAGLGEADVGASADGEVAQGLGDVAFPDADGYPRELTRPHQCL